jgi:hypothetical protein
LRPEAYWVAGLPATVAVAWWTLRGVSQAAPLRLVRRAGVWWHRRRGLPLVFLVTCSLALAGAVLWEPNNFDGLSYRIPRVLFWLEHRGWTWIDTPYAALNHTMPNYEWMSLPLFLAGGTRALVVINLAAFLAMPPLLFVLLRQFGVRGRMAWEWMWLLPAGYLVAMQAGGIGNDLIGMTAILAALYFAGRFASRGEGTDLFDALLAAGLCTGIKLSNLPLAGFVIIILLGDWRKVRAKWGAAIAGALGGLVVSAAIPMALNHAHSGTVMGTTTRMDQVTQPLAGVVGNALILGAGAVAPPLLPGANRISEWVESGLGAGLTSWLRQHYEKFSLKLNELPQEEVGGLGLGCFAAFWLVMWSGPARPVGGGRWRVLAAWQRLAWWGWLGGTGLVMLAKLGTGPAVPRNLLPWMPLVLAPLLSVRGCERMVRTRGWRLVSVVAAASVWPALVLTPSRPLIPPGALLGMAEMLGVKGRALERARVVYATYQERADPFIGIRREIPATARRLGLVSDGGEPTASWMRPYGERSCIYLRTAEEVASARASGVEYVVLKTPACRAYFQLTPEEWCARFAATVGRTTRLTIHAADGPIEFTLVKLRPGTKP